jgi:hypothetical protein
VTIAKHELATLAGAHSLEHHVTASVRLDVPVFSRQELRPMPNENEF